MARNTRLWLASLNGKRLTRSASPGRTMRTGTLRSPVVNRGKLLKAQFDAFGSGSLHNSNPRVRRNALSLTPLAHGPNVSGEVRGDNSSASEFLEKVGDGLDHATHNPLDYPSSQDPTTRPVTDSPPRAKNSRMGRGVSPTRFKAEFCDRLRAARTVAGYTQEEAAKALGMLPNTYSKYEKRTVLPAHLIPEVCDLFGVHERYLLRGEGNKATERKTA